MMLFSLKAQIIRIINNGVQNTNALNIFPNLYIYFWEYIDSEKKNNKKKQQMYNPS